MVEAFKLYPTSFCLKGYPTHPNSNAVFTFLMGKNARLIVTGWLEKSGTNAYLITAKGLEYAEAISGHSFVPSVAVHRQIEEGVAQLLESAAFQLVRDGRSDEITFHQYCRFMGLAAPDKWQLVKGRIEKVDHLVQEAVLRGEAGLDLRIHHKGRNERYSPEDLRLLKAALQFMQLRFSDRMKEWERNATR